MRAARSTKVNLEEWALSLLGTSRRESLAVEGRVRPAPTRERSSVSSQGGRSGSEKATRTDDRRGSQTTDAYRAQSRHRSGADNYDSTYERRSSRPANGD